VIHFRANNNLLVFPDWFDSVTSSFRQGNFTFDFTFTISLLLSLSISHSRSIPRLTSQQSEYHFTSLSEIILLELVETKILLYLKFHDWAMGRVLKTDLEDKMFTTQL